MSQSEEGSLAASNPTKNKTIIILQLILLKIECKLVFNVILNNIIPTQQVYNYSKQNCIN